jgi:glycosyltransferase involved in cell wall biosynthesis
VRQELGAEEGVLLVAASRLHAEKGLPALLRALAELPPSLRLAVVGVGPDRETLERLAQVLDLSARVKFLGWRSDVLSIIGAADIFVHPSLHEALPSAVIEAVALGRCVVASDVSGVRDILGDEAYGRIVPPGDVRALVAAITDVLSDPEAARARAAAGSVRLFDYMDPVRVADAHMACYRMALAASGARWSV